jgi:hypothetical protein
LTNDPKIKGSNLATGTRREKMAKNWRGWLVAGIVQWVEQSTNDPKIWGLNPAICTKRNKENGRKSWCLCSVAENQP